MSSCTKHFWVLSTAAILCRNHWVAVLPLVGPSGSLLCPKTSFCRSKRQQRSGYSGALAACRSGPSAGLSSTSVDFRGFHFWLQTDLEKHPDHFRNLEDYFCEHPEYFMNISDSFRTYQEYVRILHSQGLKRHAVVRGSPCSRGSWHHTGPWSQLPGRLINP